ncbi:nucleotide-binding domain-containing protein [Bacillus pseudomycoides]|uniref:nucleotide-binding domain-containing protein n=1 Tax=Bacillus pseudomycoides TaxID=64104 RepID=UPI000BED516D|nr:nucleotidyltransferase [Bacillus pseudomycoides]PEF72931.1 nucleotidyltransferase [Bacillus pseudomycoides]PEI37913.1 nucleotidyltransferase [Bacillus pseudomycoides]PEL81116.1 nucleotidyltransferase [Bacillus pseudomycoides]PGA66108.1 nucleotidyltransferase [Bacillus pseudomycoides]PHE05866.1 nucleotidyltransferase [Bacillus pseudomycoides]
MFDLNTKFNTFYTKHVVLSQKEKDKLHDKKELNIKRLKDGLAEHNEENDTQYKLVDTIVQGSVAMANVTQNDENEYDIDVAVIFDKDNIPTSTSAIKKIVADSLKRKTKQFKVEPQINKNAVTIEYAEGYHIDFAIYRRFKNDIDEYEYEHCGTSWAPRNPRSITEWFNEQNTESNNNLRKVVRLLKMFCKSRNGWSMPGGLMQSVLANECLKTDNRLDLTFYETIYAIRNRLVINKEVNNPADESLSLIFTEKDKKKLENLYNRLNKWIKKLELLFQVDCTEQEALAVWKNFFNHSYWGDLEEQKVENSLYKSSDLYNVSISVDVLMGESDDSVISLSHFKGKLPKEKWVRFSAKPTFNYSRIEWEVINSGDEAGEDKNHKQDGTVAYETTLYRGTHHMICRVYKKDYAYANEKLVYLKRVPISIK